MRRHATFKNLSEARRDQVLEEAPAEVEAEVALVLEHPDLNSTREWPAATQTSNAILTMECSTIVRLRCEWNQLSPATKSSDSLLCQALSDLQLLPVPDR